MEELLNRVDEVTPARIKSLLVEQAENARMSRRLATIEMESPVDFDPAAFHIKLPHAEQLSDLLRELEFTTLHKSLQASNGPSETEQPATEVIESAAAAQAFVESLPKCETLAVECLRSGGSGLPVEVQGIALSSGGKTAYIPLDVHEYMRPITTLLHETTRTKAVHDLKATLLAFHRIGITLAGPYFDTMVADYLLNPNRRDHQLDTLALEMLGQRLGGHEEHTKTPKSLFDADSGSPATIVSTTAPSPISPGSKKPRMCSAGPATSIW